MLVKKESNFKIIKSDVLQHNFSLSKIYKSVSYHAILKKIKKRNMRKETGVTCV